MIGLGNMGLNLALRMKDQGISVVGWNRSEQKRKEARDKGLEVADTLLELVDSLEGAKIVWMMISAGEGIDELLFAENGLKELLHEGDIIIDGANSHYIDTIMRAEDLGTAGITLLDCGISGGVEGARSGPCLMLGGDKNGYEFVEEMLAKVATNDGMGYFGPSGAGHYVKMVHNGIEYGMMQSIAEGLNLLESSDFDIDYEKLTTVWNNGSIIAGNLIGFANESFKEDSELSKTKSEIGSLGTGRWSAEEALYRGVPFGSITNAVYSRYQSRESDSFLFKVVQAMRAKFGGHNSKERTEQ